MMRSAPTIQPMAQPIVLPDGGRARADAGVFDLHGTPRQREIVAWALGRSSFPWDVLLPGLRASVGRSSIPVDWMDLSRWFEGHSADHAHDHGEADPLVVRERVLGLAWYSGRVTLDLSLERQPELAGEVLLSEGAHMVDFFYMTDPQRLAIFNAFHPGEGQDAPEGTPIVDGREVHHGHSWFDVGGYRSWVGEAFMGAFTRAFSDFPVTIPFEHAVTEEVIQTTRAVLLPSGPEVPPFFTAGTTVFHDSHNHPWITPQEYFASYGEAVSAGKRPCRVCKPRRSE